MNPTGIRTQHSDLSFKPASYYPTVIPAVYYTGPSKYPAVTVNMGTGSWTLCGRIKIFLLYLNQALNLHLSIVLETSIKKCSDFGSNNTHLLIKAA